jgi:hypothetical protein
MANAKAEKCANTACGCMTTSGKHCSPQCEALDMKPDIACSCGHPGCKGNTLR